MASAVLVLDEQMESQRLVAALTDRGHEVRVVGDFGAQGRPDPDVVRHVANQIDRPWVLVTMDLSIIEEFKGFDWSRYAIAWLRIRKELRGRQVEIAKANAVHKHLERIAGQQPGDHFTYTPDRYSPNPPSVAVMTEKHV